MAETKAATAGRARDRRTRSHFFGRLPCQFAAERHALEEIDTQQAAIVTFVLEYFREAEVNRRKLFLANRTRRFLINSLFNSLDRSHRNVPTAGVS